MLAQVCSAQTFEINANFQGLSLPQNTLETPATQDVLPWPSVNDNETRSRARVLVALVADDEVEFGAGLGGVLEGVGHVGAVVDGVALGKSGCSAVASLNRRMLPLCYHAGAHFITAVHNSEEYISTRGCKIEQKTAQDTRARRWVVKPATAEANRSRSTGR